MNRRSFLKTIAIASVSLAIAPTDFLTPYSPIEQIRLINPALKFVGWKKIGPDLWEATIEAKINPTRMAFGIIKEK